MLYLIGLGLNEKGISNEGFEVISRCKKVYLETYTINFPYNPKYLEELFQKRIEFLDRKEVESERLIKEAKKEDVCLLIYGSPLFATTHTALILDCNKAKVKTKVIHSASVLDSISETGLQLYKFGKISSMPKWQKNFTPDSFLDFVIQNKSIGAHSLILIDIGLQFNEAIKQLILSCKNKNFFIEKLVVCSLLGTNKSKIFYSNIKNITNR